MVPAFARSHGTWGRSASTISRELRRNSHPTTRNYRPYAAQKRCVIRAGRPKPSKLDDRLLAAAVEERLRKNWSPQQISGDLAVVFAGQDELQVSHETIYHSLYVQSRGYVGVHLHRHLRRGRSARKPRATQLTAVGKIRDKVMLSERPKEANDRLVAGHWEGDLIVGSASGSAIATLVERTTRFVILVHLPNGLLRQYFPKGTDLNAHSAKRLLEVATELNERPRKTLKRNAPANLLGELVSKKEITPVASTT